MEPDNYRFMSAIVPVYNEVESLPYLMDRLTPVLADLGSYEIIFVDDGSNDGSESVLHEILQQYLGIVRIVSLRTNCGKSTALQAGFQLSNAKYVVMLDADLQDQPEEIPKLLEVLERDNLDVVTGWKFHRHDPVGKLLPSRFFNFVIRYFSGLKIHDFNCGLKLMKLECAKSLDLHGQLHRFLLVLLAHKGFRIGEVPVQHAARKYGVSKYGGKRLFEGFMDFMTIFFLTRYLQSPLYFFGHYAIACLVMAFIISAFFIPLHFYSVYNGIPEGTLDKHPLWLLSPILFLVGIIFIFFGILGELLIYLIPHSSKSVPVKEVLGIDQPHEKA